MKITELLKSFSTLPKWMIELLAFLLFSFVGAIHKMIRENQRGVKITFKKTLAEAFMSLFIASIVFAVFDQFCHFNKLFTYSMCSLSGSMSTKITDKIELSIDWLFELAKRAANKYLNINA